MKLTDSEILLLVQALFLLKSNSSLLDWKTIKKVESLHEKLTHHFVSSDKEHQYEGSFILKHEECLNDHDDVCGWDDDHDENFYHEEDSYDYEISVKDLLKLEPIKVGENNERTLSFVDGFNGMVDLSFDKGDEIICDVTKIIRSKNTVEFYTAEGWKLFKVNNFHKDWLAMLTLDNIASLKEEK